MRTRTALAALAVAAPALALAPAAHANSGDFEAGVYYSALGGDTQASIQSRCGCSGSATNRADGSKVVAYDADNASFSWNVTIIEITYRYNGSAWVAYNGWTNPTSGKMRYSPTRSPYQFYDPINFTG